VRTHAALLLGASVLACANCRSGGDGSRMLPTKNGTVVRNTTVTMANADAGVSLEGAAGFSAMQACTLEEGGRRLLCDLPPLAAKGGLPRVALVDLTKERPSVGIESGTLPGGNAPVVLENGRARLVNGTALLVEPDPSLGPPEYVRAGWYASASGRGPVIRLAGITGKGPWIIEAFDRTGGTRLWRQGAPELTGEPIAAALSLDGSAMAVALKTSPAARAYELIRVDGATGAVRWRAPLSAMPLGTIAFSTDGTTLLVTARDAARCESCVHLFLVSVSDGRGVREIPLPAASIAETATSTGFNGDTAWFYRYVPAHTTSEFAPRGRTPVSAGCAYEVYDLVAPDRPVRTLRDAAGDWKDTAAACGVRTLLPLADGHTLAIKVNGDVDLAVVEFDGPP